MEPVQHVEQGFFPLDEELALFSGALSPSLKDHLSHLGNWMPFRRAAQVIQRLLGVQVSEATVRRHTEAAGVVYEQQQTQASQQYVPTADPSSLAQVRERRLVLSADGAYVGLIKGAWAEVRTLVIGEVSTSYSPQQEAKTHALSYFSRMTNAQTFTSLAEVEMRRRGVVEAGQVCAVTDGADWLQGFIDVHRGDALRILDFPHAAQRFGMIAEAYAQHGQALPTSWAHEQCHDLKKHGPAEVLQRVRTLPLLQAHEEHLHYLEKREDCMDYPTYQAAGWPLGSGMVESGNKVVMQTRLKGPGMRWEPKHVNPMLALRTAICNDRWDEAWQVVVKQEQERRRQRRLQKASPRLISLLCSVWLAQIRTRPRPTSPAAPFLPRPSQPPATLPGSSHPSAHHPWKRGSACRPKLSAKI